MPGNKSNFFEILIIYSTETYKLIIAQQKNSASVRKSFHIKKY